MINFIINNNLILYLKLVLEIKIRCQENPLFFDKLKQQNFLSHYFQDFGINSFLFRLSENYSNFHQNNHNVK